jgi:hypothetical protein
MMKARAAILCGEFFLAVLLSATSPAAALDDAAIAGRLLSAYPKHLKTVEGGEIVWQDGSRMPLNDGLGAKSFEALLDRPDLKDQFLMEYRTGGLDAPPPENFDPGRVRYEPFFQKMYGACGWGADAQKLVTVNWLPRHRGGIVTVTAVNRVHEHLEAASKELDELPDRFVKYLLPLSGAYNCRAIAGTSRRSMHAYGAAIDIDAKQADYWKWAGKDALGKYPYRNNIPQEIVDIFERHGFIWGGKWYHYDTMHFEYRPELLR